MAAKQRVDISQLSKARTVERRSKFNSTEGTSWKTRPVDNHCVTRIANLSRKLKTYCDNLMRNALLIVRASSSPSGEGMFAATSRRTYFDLSFARVSIRRLGVEAFAATLLRMYFDLSFASTSSRFGGVAGFAATDARTHFPLSLVSVSSTLAGVNGFLATSLRINSFVSFVSDLNTLARKDLDVEGL
jgi:hypothetical protein